MLNPHFGKPEKKIEKDGILSQPAQTQSCLKQTLPGNLESRYDNDDDDDDDDDEEEDD